MITLNDKIILITGVTGALGHSTAECFQQAGATLAITGRNANKLAQVNTQLRLGSDHHTQACDLTDLQQCTHMVDAIIERYGRIDALLNVAGGFAMGKTVETLSNEDFNAMFDMNFTSTFNACRAVMPHMITQGHGNIVNVSARAALAGKGKMAPYCISKSAVVTLTESLAAEHHADDININCILPGTIDTAINRADMPNADHSTWVPCEDLANTMLFLTSPLACSINGAVIPVVGKS